MKCEKCSKCESCEKSTHRYCADILIQLSAISKSLESVENSILESHIKSCVLTEIQSGNTEIIDEVMELFRRLR